MKPTIENTKLDKNQKRVRGTSLALIGLLRWARSGSGDCQEKRISTVDLFSLGFGSGEETFKRIACRRNILEPLESFRISRRSWEMSRESGAFEEIIFESWYLEFKLVGVIQRRNKLWLLRYVTNDLSSLGIFLTAGISYPFSIFVLDSFRMLRTF